MSESTAVQPTVSEVPVPPEAPPASDSAPVALKPRSQPSAWKQALAGLASLRLTVVLFVFSILIVLFGTLAQVDAGIWQVVNEYFRSVFVWVPTKIFFPRAWAAEGGLRAWVVQFGFPFPSGWLIGALLLVNLLAAHMVRFKLSWKRSGILLIHGGLIVMMLGELATGLFAVESTMSISTNETVGYLDISNTVELALADTSNPKSNAVATIPAAMLKQKGKVVSHESLPVDVEVVEYWPHTHMEGLGRATGWEYVNGGNDGDPNVRTSEDGSRWKMVPRTSTSGVDEKQREDSASARLTFKKKGTGEVLGTYLVSMWYYPNYTNRQIDMGPQTLTVDGKTYQVDLRPRREYKPYQVQLLEFRHDKYPGTETAKNYSSKIRLIDREAGEDREVKISMNDPMRYAGATFYQSGVLGGDTGTVLQVVRNPGWLMPYLSCFIVSLGMLIHFGNHLIGFLRLRTAK